MTMNIEDIEGIGPAYGEKLRTVEIITVESLLEKGANPAGRKMISEMTGIDSSKILKWVNLCDLCRISGISTQYSELLEIAGVDTVKELRNRNAENLHIKIQEVNAEKKLVRRTPGLQSVLSWVEQAKIMDPAVQY